ncbi:MAG: transcriptional regulator [Spirochaetes bacterium]|nr:MAG: transcriptional regulator [Spirochaetota bacterium]
MTIDDRAEEILESLWVGTEEMGREEVSLDDLGIKEEDKALQNLISQGYVSRDNDKVALLKEGRDEAEGTVRRHRLAERLLVDILDVKGELVNESACKFEHLLKKGIDDKICTLLGHPKLCPHEKQIPPGICCKETRESGVKLVSPLTGLKPEQSGSIAYLASRDSKKIKKLMSMGVLPGNRITLVSGFPSYVFQIGYSQFAVDREMAQNIYVRVEGEGRS